MSRFTSLRQTGALAAFLAVFAFGFAAMAVDTVANTYQERLAAAMQSINKHYEDVKRELHEEYQAITEEKDENCNAIFEKVRALKAERQDALKKFGEQKSALDKSVAAADINAADKRYITENAAMGDEGAQIRRAYDNSLETLQQLYTLNGRRYNELLKIHNAREALEENRFRELRDIASRSIRADLRADNAKLIDAEKREMTVGKDYLAAEEKRATDRYNTALDALDDYKDLVNKRIAAQSDYLKRYDSIMKDLAKPNLTAADRTSYTEDLAKLNADKDAAERSYENAARYIDEKLSAERLRSRELFGVENDRREIEAAWAKQDGRYAERRTQLKDRLGQANLSADAKKALDSEIAALDQRYADAKTAQANAIENIDSRQKLAQRALDERMAYLKARNDIRARMAGKPVSEENFKGFRDEVAKLEEKRIASERDIRNQMAALAGAMPAAFRGSRWDRGDVQTRGARMMGRIDGMRDTIQSKYDETLQQYNTSIDSLDKRLAAGGLTDAERQGIMAEKDKAQKELDAAKERFDGALKNVDERKDAEQKRLAARAQYIAQRNDMRDKLNAADVSHDDLVKQEQQLATLDRQFADGEKQFRASQKPLGTLVPAEAADANWRDRIRADWDRGMTWLHDEFGPSNRPAEQAAKAAAAASSMAAVTGSVGVPGYPPLPPQYDNVQQTRAVGNAVSSVTSAADRAVAGAENAADKAVAATKSAADKAVADTKAAADKAVADTRAATNKAIADTKSVAGKAVSGVESAADKAAASVKSAAGTVAADTRSVADKAATGVKSAAGSIADDTRSAADKVAGTTTAAATAAGTTAANATTPREGVYERDRAAGEGVWESLKDAIVTTYHDAVDYLTD